MRVTKCEQCGALLPEGGRIDRRYCREACRAMAYRQRRPNKASELDLSGSAPTPGGDANQGSLPLVMSQLLAKLIDEVATLKQRLAALEELVQAQAPRQSVHRDGSESAGDRQPPQDLNPVPLPATDHDPSQPVAEVATSSIAGDIQPPAEPSAADSPPPAIGAAAPLPIESSVAGPPSPALSTSDSPPPELSTADPPATLLSATAPPSEPSSAGHSPCIRRVDSSRPWMIALSGSTDAVVPKWTLWRAGFLQSVDSYAERILDAVPEIVSSEGREDQASQLRSWLTREKHLALQCASLMARRISATNSSARQSTVQRLNLATLVARDLSGFIAWKDQTEREQGEQSLASNQDKLVLVAALLAVALRSIDDTKAQK